MSFLGINNEKKYLEVESFSKDFFNLLSEDKYISRKEYLKITSTISSTINDFKIMKKNNVLSSWCKKNFCSIKKLESYINSYDKGENLVEKHNQSFIFRHLKEDKNYLDVILKKDDPNILLDDEQRKVVLSDEDYTLVVAGAGAGKTTTIEAKVSYLVQMQSVDPADILVVSFTRKATQELRERFNRLEIPINIATFHSIGNTIIKENEDVRHKIIDQGFMYNTIKQYLCEKLEDEYFIKKILLFFASYLNMPFDGNNTTLLYKTLAANDVTTLRSDLAKILDDYQKVQTKNKITINDEHVRSLEECRIANFLFIKGIDYVYEPVYRYGFEDTTKPYCPDFLIKYNGEEIYIEHFGISQDGENNRFSESELVKYKKHINDKIKLHKKHGTRLIYTFSNYKDGKDYIAHLEEELSKNGVKFDARDSIDIYKKLAKNAEDKYFNKFILLLCNFINRFKINNYDPETKFDEWLFNIKNERTKLFLEIAKQCFHVYEANRLAAKAIDFEDMINDAANYLDNNIKQGIKLPYKYILVDEYQDISIQRFDLCEKLAKCSDAKIIAVGDDWQSIYRFSGSRIDLFTKFREKMGYGNILKITNTYRNSQELIDIAGGFVMKNDKQIKKDLKSKKSIKDPVLLMSYDDSYYKDEKGHTAYYRMGEAVQYALDDIVAKNGTNKSVLFIGRYNFDRYNLQNLNDLFEVTDKKIISKKYPLLQISFLTAHSSKGLGYDNVVVLNGKDAVLGFPSKIEDDPVMKLVIKDEDEMDYDEERRLFYVALTRTKNRVYLITPQQKPSKFILELKQSFTNIELKGGELTPIEDEYFKHMCPVCGYPLQKRQSNIKNLIGIKTLWICSNDPEVCGFMTNDLRGGKLSISKCPNCEDGYLIVKPYKNKEGIENGRMLGCTNYKNDGTGCNFNMFTRNYTQNKNEIKISEGSFNKDSLKGLICQIYDLLEIVKLKVPSFKFTTKSLADFLLGNDNKSIEAFKLTTISETYGILRKKRAKDVFRLINSMITVGILQSIEDQKYSNIEIRSSYPNDEQIMYIRELMK